jgi:hypothetical protein
MATWNYSVLIGMGTAELVFSKAGDVRIIRPANRAS